jgi:hypothetical protein
MPARVRPCHWCSHPTNESRVTWEASGLTPPERLGRLAGQRTFRCRCPAARRPEEWHCKLIEPKTQVMVTALRSTRIGGRTSGPYPASLAVVICGPRIAVVKVPRVSADVLATDSGPIRELSGVELAAFQSEAPQIVGRRLPGANARSTEWTAQHSIDIPVSVVDPPEKSDRGTAAPTALRPVLKSDSMTHLERATLDESALNRSGRPGLAIRRTRNVELTFLEIVDSWRAVSSTHFSHRGRDDTQTLERMEM